MMFRRAAILLLLFSVIAPTAQAESYGTKVKGWAKSGLEYYSPINRQLESGESPCSLGASTVWDSQLIGLSEEAVSQGLQEGDKIIRINGEPYDADNRTKLLARYTAGDRLNIEMERNGERIEIGIVCIDQTEKYQAYEAMLKYASKGKWQKCIDESYKIDRMNGHLTGHVALQRLNCSEAKRCGSFGCKQATADQASIGYDFHRITIEEAIVVDKLDDVRGRVLSGIEWLEDVGYRSLARDLESKLYAATAASTAPAGKAEPSVAQAESYGTCFAVSDSQVLTSHHVVSSANMVTVRFHDGREVGAIVDQQSQSTDLALLRVNGKAPAVLPLAPMRSLDVGEEVFTVGFPVTQILGSDAKFTEGSVSSLSGVQGDSSFFQMSVPIQPGNSGGPVVNMKGEVVGVVASTAAVEAFYALSGSLPQSVNWAAKADYARLMFEPPNIEWRAKDRSQAIERAKLAVCQVKAVSN